MVRFIKTMAPLLVGALLAGDAGAVGTRRFVLDDEDSFDGGDLTGVSISSSGTVRAGWTLADAPIPDVTSVWCSLVLQDGTVLLGTGTGGRVYSVKAGKVSVFAETGAMAVSSLALGPGGDIFAGTFPEAKIFRFKPGAKAEDKPNPWVTLKDTEDVWDLAYDPKGNALYAATGPEGKLFRLTAAGNPEVYFDSEDPHLVSVAIAPDGTVYTGSNGKALLYKLTGPGRASVAYDFEGDDVKDIAITQDGTVFAVANDYRGSNPSRPTRGNAMAVGPSPSKPNKPGRGQLMRFDKGGVAEVMFESKDSHFTVLALDDQERPLLGTAGDGRVYTVSDNHVERLLVDTEESQVGAIAFGPKARFVATGDPVVFHEIKGVGGPDAVWTSEALDAGLRAHFGKLDWQADGTLELQTRSGNTEKPDGTWSAWSSPLAAPGKVTSPAARFLQIRARWAKDPKAVLHRVEAAFVTDNARALLTELTVGDSSSNKGGSSVPESGGPPDDPSSKVKLQWKVDNPDNDKLRYRVYYRRPGTKAWIAILEPSEELTGTSYTWDTSGLPEGRYQIKVDVSDELSNPPGRVTRHSMTSQLVAVDNTAPALTSLQLRGGRLQGTASDQVGPIARIEFGLVGGKSWWPIFPSDDIYDEAEESFDVDVKAMVPQGPHMVVVRAYDSAGNRIERTVSTK